MKKNILAFILLAIFNPVFAQEKTSPVEYLNMMGAEFSAVSHEIMSYTSAASHGKSAKKVEKRRQELLTRLQLAERNIRKMKPYEGDASLRDSVVHYFDLSYIVLNEDFGKIVDLEEVAEQSYDAMEAYMLAKEKANEKLDVAGDAVRNEQDVFVKNYNIKVVADKSKVGQKLEKSSKVYKYYNQIYLLFFKSYKDEAYFLDALGKPDINAKEQTKNALEKSSQEGLGKIGPIPAFMGDNSLKTSCQQLLNFFKYETASAPTLIEFELKKENFEKIKTAFEAKSQSERTKADVENYNKAITDFNQAVNKANALNNDLNKKRSQLFDQWNKAADNFLNRHVPKHNG